MGMDEDQLRSEATERLKARREFWQHLAAYVIVNAGLIAIWAIGGARLLLARLGPRRMGDRPSDARMERVHGEADPRGRDPARDGAAPPRAAHGQLTEPDELVREGDLAIR